MGRYNIITMRNNSSGRIIKLYEMVHIASEGFYKKIDYELMKDYENGYVIHMEGISLEGSKSKNTLWYNNKSLIIIMNC